MKNNKKPPLEKWFQKKIEKKLCFAFRHLQAKNG